MEPIKNTRRGLENVRKLVEVKEQEQKAFEKAFRSDPAIRAIFDELKKRNAKRQIAT